MGPDLSFRLSFSTYIKCVLLTKVVAEKLKYRKTFYMKDKKVIKESWDCLKILD